MAEWSVYRRPNNELWLKRQWTDTRGTLTPKMQMIDGVVLSATLRDDPRVKKWKWGWSDSPLADAYRAMIKIARQTDRP